MQNRALPALLVFRALKRCPFAFYPTITPGLGTVALPPLREDITDVGAIIAELSHNFHHFPYLFFYP